MNYLKCYYNLINKAFLGKRKKSKKNYYEGHHVKPKCFGGTRIVLLTAREHYIAHFLLYKHYKKYGNTNQKQKMSYAWNIMTWQSPDNIQRYTSHTYNYARLEFSKNITGENHPFYGCHHTIESKKKMSQALLNMSDEAKLAKSKKQSAAKKGIPWTAKKRKIILNARKSAREKLPDKWEIIFADGKRDSSSSKSQLIQKYNLSRSMILRSVQNEPIKYGDPQSRIKSEKTENTVGCIFNKIVL